MVYNKVFIISNLITERKELLYMKILFMLPARSGSKGLKDKNIKEINGHPLMFYAINAILESSSYKNHKCYVMLNTDSQNYADIGISLGAKVPFIRDKKLSKDNTCIVDVIDNSISYFKDRQVDFDLFAMVQVTSPLITAQDIDNAIHMFEEDSQLDTINSVTESEIMPLWCNTLDKDLDMKDFISEEIRKKNRQELPVYYRITGAIRISKWNHFINNKYDWYQGNVKALIMDNAHSVDIDTVEDFEWAKLLLKRRSKND